MKRRDFLKTSLLVAGAVFVSPTLLIPQKTYRGKFFLETSDWGATKMVGLAVFDGEELLYRKGVSHDGKDNKTDYEYAKLLLKTWQKETAPDMKIIYED